MRCALQITMLKAAVHLYFTAEPAKSSSDRGIVTRHPTQAEYDDSFLAREAKQLSLEIH